MFSSNHGFFQGFFHISQALHPMFPYVSSPFWCNPIIVGFQPPSPWTLAGTTAEASPYAGATELCAERLVLANRVIFFGENEGSIYMENEGFLQ
jgi:hypothetical protein